MRPNRRQFPAGWFLTVSLCQFGPMVIAADEPKPVAKTDRMAAIVAALRAEEMKYQNIEYVARIVVRDLKRKEPADPGNVTTQATRRVVLLGDRIYFREEAFERVLATRQHREEVSAYDGERTRTVIAGNCVNIHLSRFEHPDVYPAHSLPLAHYCVNLPLSVYLSGTEAIHAHPKYPRFNHESGSVYEFTRVATHFEGEELVDGLRCLKVRVDRWRYSNDFPNLQYLWLAPERNYLCVKEQVSWPRSQFGDLPFVEMRVTGLREVTPGVWSPGKITVINYDIEALKKKKQVVSDRTETIVEKIDLAPHHEAAFFRDISFPKGLPVFTIKDGALVGSTMPEPIGGEAEKTKLAEVVGQVAEQEKHYAHLEVKARMSYKSLASNIVMEGLITEETQEEHSVLEDKRAYYTSNQAHTTLGGSRSEHVRVEAFDGQWTRGLDRFDRQDGSSQVLASLRKGGMGKAEGRNDGIPVYQPHTLMLRVNRIYGQLADLLVSPWLDKRNKYRLQFRHCGETVVDGHPCIRLRAETLIDGQNQRHSSFDLFLATDRNDVPIKMEHYGGNFGYRAMPTGIGRCDDFREIAPGVWYPFRVTALSFDPSIPMAQGRIVLSWRRDYTIESVVLNPRVDNALFHDVIVPEGTSVKVLDEDQNRVGQFVQPQDGVASITTARYGELVSQARRAAAKKAQQKKRRQ